VYVPRNEPRYDDDYYSYGPRASKDRSADADGMGGASAEAKPSPAAPPPTTTPLREEAEKSSRGRALAEPDSAQKRRPGLGTAFGERVDSPIQEVSFARANPTSPAATLGVRYNDHDGLLAMGVSVDGDGYPYDEVYTRRTAQPFPVTERRYAAPPPGWEYRY
jgi:hypothetical protein